MLRYLIFGLLVILACTIVQADTLVLKDGRQYTGIVVKNGRNYTVFIGQRQFNIPDDEVQDWIKGDVRPEKSLVKPKTTATHAGIPRPRKGDPKTVETLERHGRDALAAGAYRVARNAYFDLLLIDPADPLGQEGAGLAYLAMGDAARGKQLLESSLSNAGAISRSIVLNTALANVRTKSAVRAAKIIRDYLTATGAEDTRALDLLALAIAQTDGPATKTHVYEETKKFAADYETKLQARHPGLKRWGAEWVTPEEVASHEREQKADQATVRQAEAALAEQKNAVAKADTDLAALQLKQTRGVNVATAIDRQNREVNRLRAIANDMELKLAVMRGTAMSASASALALEPMLPGDDSTPTAVAVAENPPKPHDQVAINTPRPTPSPSPEPTPRPAPTPTPVHTPTPQPDPAPLPVPVDHPRRREVVDYAAAFAVAPDLVVTDAVAVESATTIRLQSGDGVPMDATVLRKDDETGLALLRVEGGKLAYVVLDAKFAGGAIQCVSYPNVDLFDPSAQVISGTVPAPAATWTVRLDRHPRLAGGPLVAPNGKVVGVELASRDTGTGQVRAATVKDLLQLLAADAPSTPGTARASDATLQVTATHEK